MKKVLILLLFIVSISSFGLKKYSFRFSNIHIHDVDLGAKRSKRRDLNGYIKNNGSREIKHVVINVKYRDLEKEKRYKIIEDLKIRNIGVGESKGFYKRIVVGDLEGRDMKIVVEELVYKK